MKKILKKLSNFVLQADITGGAITQHRDQHTHYNQIIVRTYFLMVHKL